MVSLIWERATKINVINNLTEAKEINIDLIHDFNVNYAVDDLHCTATLRAGFHMKDQPDILTVICTVVGEFEAQDISTVEGKKKTHVECYYRLFPYAQALVMRLCADAGLPPFYLQALDMKEENVTISE